MDRFETAIVWIIGVLVIWLVIGQISVKQEYNEKQLARALQMKRFLASGHTSQISGLKPAPVPARGTCYLQLATSGRRPR